MKPVAAVLALALAACIPAPYGEYYRPDHPDPSVTRAGEYCHGAAGAPTRLAITVAGDVRLGIEARVSSDAAAPGLDIVLSAVVPAGHELRFTAAGFDADDGQGDTRHLAPAASASASLDVAADAPIDPAILAPAAPVPGRDFRLGLSHAWQFGADWPPSVFTMRLPAVTLDAPSPSPSPSPSPATGAAVAGTVPVVGADGTARQPARDIAARAWRRPDGSASPPRPGRTVVWITDESEARRAEREQRCRAETPARRCDLIAAYDDGGFSLADGPLAWQGRWWRHDIASADPARGELALRLDRPLRLRLDPPELVFTGADGAVWRHRIEKLRLTVGQGLALDTPLRGVGAEGTRLGAVARLPRALDDHAAACRHRRPAASDRPLRDRTPPLRRRSAALQLLSRLRALAPSAPRCRPPDQNVLPDERQPPRSVG